MNTQAIVGISAVAATLVLGMFGFMMNIKSDIVGVHEAIAGVHKDMKDLTDRVAGIETLVDVIKNRLEGGGVNLNVSRVEYPYKRESCEPDSLEMYPDKNKINKIRD